MLVLFCGITWTPCNLGVVAWWDTPQLQDWIASILKRVRGVAFIISAVLELVLLGSEPHATLALWLGRMQHYSGVRTLTVITQSSKIRCTERMSCTNSSRWQAFCRGVRGLQLHQCNVGFVLCYHMNPMQLGCCGLVAFTTTTLEDSKYLKGCKGVAIIISAVLVLVLLDYVSPMTRWLSGLVGCSITTVQDFWPWSLSDEK
jgi:hypothetical protein